MHVSLLIDYCTHERINLSEETWTVFQRNTNFLISHPITEDLLDTLVTFNIQKLKSRQKINQKPIKMP